MLISILIIFNKTTPIYEMLALYPHCGKGKPFRRSAFLLPGLSQTLFIPLPLGKSSRTRSDRSPSFSASCL